MRYSPEDRMLSLRCSPETAGVFFKSLDERVYSLPLVVETLAKLRGDEDLRLKLVYDDSVPFGTIEGKRMGRTRIMEWPFESDPSKIVEALTALLRLGSLHRLLLTHYLSRRVPCES